MPNCFLLRNRATGEPDTLSDIDDKMREYFVVPPNATEWYQGWYDSVGLMLACGQTFDQIRKICPLMGAIVDWLDMHYVAEAWSER